MEASNSSSHDGLAAMLVPCPPVTFQGLEEAMVARKSLKRPAIYSIFETTSEDTGGNDFDAADDYNSHYHVEKKRRLTADQVKSLERSFEVENKLEPERKLHLARELGLQPRQVAVWFQNRRARWKTKQLEKDYDLLKADYDALKRNYEAAIHDKEKLQDQLLRLNETLRATDTENLQPREPSGSEKSREIVSGQICEQSFTSKARTIDQDLVSLNAVTLESLRRASSSSDSDVDSEVLDVESPLNHIAQYHPLCSDQLPNLIIGSCADPSSLISMGEDDCEKVHLPHHCSQYVRSAVKLETDESQSEENSTYLLTLEDQVTSFSWWDWS